MKCDSTGIVRFSLFPGLVLCCLTVAGAAGGRTHQLPLRRRPMANRARYLPNDTALTNQWYLYNTGLGGGVTNRDIFAELAWDVTRGTSSVIIAILDDGIQMDHPDLADSIYYNSQEGTPGVDGDGNGYTNDWRGWDFVDDDNNPSPLSILDNHGTAMAGIAAGVAGNGQGIAGVANKCKLLPVRIAGDVTVGEWAEAIRYAADIADVISISYYLDTDPAIYDALNYAVTHGRGGKGCVVLTALGNDGVRRRYASDATACPQVVSVSGASNYDRRSWFADYGAPVDLVAPAAGGSLSLFTTDRTGIPGYSSTADYVYVGAAGTSPSCPIAAGVVALILSADESLTGLEARRRLESSCDRIDRARYSYERRGRNDNYGAGRINALSALQLEIPQWDSYEPDDSTNIASLIEDGGLQYRSLDNGADVDWARVVLTNTSHVRLTVVGTTNAQLRLYDSEAALVAQQDTGVLPYVQLTTNGIPAGVYYARIDCLGGTGVEHYALHLGLMNIVDAYETDSPGVVASPIAPREMQYHTLYPAGDDDWVTFTLDSTMDVDIWTMGEWDGWMDLELYNTNESLLHVWDPDTNVVVNISTQLPPSTYYLKMKDHEGFYELTSYQVLLETHEPDGHEPDGSYLQAAAIESGDRAMRTLFPGGDKDWFTFTLEKQANVLLMVDTINPYLACDTVLTVYLDDGGLQEVGANDDGNNVLFSAAYLQDLRAGTYYAEVKGKDGGVTCPDYYLALDVSEQPVLIGNYSKSTNGTYSFTWQGDSSYTYEVQYANGPGKPLVWNTATNFEGRLGTNSWIDDGTGTGGHPGSAVRRYYRVKTK